MFVDLKKLLLIPSWFEYIKVHSVGQAYCQIVGRAASSLAFQCYAQKKGKVRDLRFFDAYGNQYFAIIINKQSLLFYFRKPAIKIGDYNFEALQRAFPLAQLNAAKEWTVRLLNIEDVERLWLFIENKEYDRQAP